MTKAERQRYWERLRQERAERLRELEARFGDLRPAWRRRKKEPTAEVLAARKERRRQRQQERRRVRAGLLTEKGWRKFRTVHPVKFTCAQCGEEFLPQRSTAKFCSARCRVYWHRRQGCYAK
jgi:hypothetical protein